MRLINYEVKPECPWSRIPNIRKHCLPKATPRENLIEQKKLKTKRIAHQIVEAGGDTLLAKYIMMKHLWEGTCVVETLVPPTSRALNTFLGAIFKEKGWY